MQEHAGDPQWDVKRGNHRERAWYTAISEACPQYLGIQLPEFCWPHGPRTPRGTLTEVEMCRWPESIRRLVETGDPRVPRREWCTSTNVRAAR